MKTYYITVSLSGTYEFTIEAGNKEIAETIANSMEIDLDLVEYWDTKTEIEEID